jgi:hypothetical protein
VAVLAAAACAIAYAEPAVAREAIAIVVGLAGWAATRMLDKRP